MLDELKDLYQEMILDHNRNPRNFGVLEGANRSARGSNPLCGDHYTIYARIDGEVLRDISFLGSGCAISKASASILTGCLKGMTKAEVRMLFDKVQAMLVGGRMDGDLGKLAALAGVHQFPARVKCAMLPWHALLAALEGVNSPVSTETNLALP